MSYWEIIGRGCVDEGFLAESSIRLRSEESDTSQLEDLWRFLCESHDYRVSRWQLGDINRLLGQIHSPKSNRLFGAPKEAVRETADTLRRAKREHEDAKPIGISSEAHALIGACAIDHELKRLYLEAARQPDRVPAIEHQAGLAPKFQLKGHDAKVVADFFADPATDALLTQVHDLIWIVPNPPHNFVPRNVACAGGVFPTPPEGKEPYHYVPAPLLDQFAPQFSRQLESMGF